MTSSTSRVDPVLAILAILSLMMGIALWRTHTPMDADVPRSPWQTRVNPNTAPWWELMVLPDVGESTARRIVEYREAHADQTPVFRRAADLEPVPDIGPKTLARIAPYLRFE
jgi:DNA uptake protein ComE-like DNA-binding protein